ncbi:MULTISPECIES: alpha/beta hydrolase [unclassified Clostridium]|uniref:alpha/beta hydrolase n=1 Tax=unclassified Clostridium TaxID=2614128 RepID=UPI0013F00E1C|nr:MULTISPECIES: alpha/beta hydrolase [unclassified Clostridium]NFG61064.1 alpha/beta hydrolase [Clostridium botulinum]NFQ09350.1 alpha/beta hydrolase [Clostridium botulinum]
MYNNNFKVGTYNLNSEPNFNYQLNRTILWSNGDAEEIKSISYLIKTPKDWEREMLKLGDKALNEKRIEQAIAYYRMAEFFMFHENSDKIKVYEKAKKLFYDLNSNIFIKEGIIKREKIKYDNGYLPVWVSLPEKESKGAIVIFGGNDSYIEEFKSTVLYLRGKGHAVYAFEGPGQGEVLRKYNIPFTHKWEEPVKCVLDYYNLNDVTVIGISLGGILAPRAAAFEKRITKVVAWSIFPSFFDILISTRTKTVQRIVRVLFKLKQKFMINKLMEKQMKKDPMAEWGIKHGIYNFGVNTPYDYFAKSMNFQIYNIAPLIKQDFLLIGASKDHFIPKEFYKKEIDALTNVKSLTFKLFNEKQFAERHCNVGNTKLVLESIVNWIDNISKIN